MILTYKQMIAIIAKYKEHKLFGLEKNKNITKLGGHVAKVVSKDNVLPYVYVDDNKMIEKK